MRRFKVTVEDPQGNELSTLAEQSGEVSYEVMLLLFWRALHGEALKTHISPGNTLSLWGKQDGDWECVYSIAATALPTGVVW